MADAPKRYTTVTSGGGTFTGGTVADATTFSSAVTFSNAILMRDGDGAVANAAQFTADTNSGIYRIGADDWAAIAGALICARFRASGGIGILHVDLLTIGNTSDTALRRVAAGVVRITDSATTGLGWIQNSAGSTRLVADVTNGTTTMANLTGLSVTLIAGRFYTFRLSLFVENTVAADGVKVDFDGGTATMTSFRAHGTVFDTALLLSSQVSALATDFAVATVTGPALVEVRGGFVCNAAGTFIPRQAMNAATTGVLTTYLNSHMLVEDMPA